MSVYKKLQEARVKLQKMSLKKSGENKFAKYSYFELGDFLPTVQEIFQEVGLCGTVSFHKDHATLHVVDCINADNFIEFSTPSVDVDLKGCIPIQGIGAAQTYLRRYLWVTAMEIVENDSIDATTGDDAGKKQAQSVVSPKAAEPKVAKRNPTKEMLEAAIKDGMPGVYKVFYESGLSKEEQVEAWKAADKTTQNYLTEERKKRTNG